MSRRRSVRVLVPVLAVAVAIAVVIPAMADPAQDAQSRATVRTIGGFKVKINKSASDTQRFSPGLVRIDSGGRLTIRDRTRQDHTLSVVRRSQLPRNARQVENCFSQNGICGRLAVDHGAINPDTGEEQEPTEPLVNVGGDGFDRPGDSIVIPGRRSRTVRVTARRGNDLYYLCAIHAWMQGRLDVR
jgi:hypothetical protein